MAPGFPHQGGPQVIEMFPGIPAFFQHGFSSFCSNRNSNSALLSRAPRLSKAAVTKGSQIKIRVTLDYEIAEKAPGCRAVLKSMPGESYGAEKTLNFAQPTDDGILIRSDGIEASPSAQYLSLSQIWNALGGGLNQLLQKSSIRVGVETGGFPGVGHARKNPFSFPPEIKKSILENGQGKRPGESLKLSGYIYLAPVGLDGQVQACRGRNFRCPGAGCVDHNGRGKSSP
jgi:hypothetical protein